MGFSPQSGLENATRHGDLDVFAVLYMMERHGWSAEEVRRQLAKGGGLAGLSGVAGGDVRDLEAAAARRAARRLALDVFVYQVKKTIGAYAAAMGGLDAVAFTGGIGENSARAAGGVLRGAGVPGDRAGPRSATNSGERRPGGVGGRVASHGAGAGDERGADRGAAGVPLPKATEALSATAPSFSD